MYGTYDYLKYCLQERRKTRSFSVSLHANVFVEALLGRFV